MRKSLALSLLAVPLLVQAESVMVAVAANFSAPMKIIAENFEKETGHQAVLSFGATGQLYAQIANGAPYAVFLSADQKTPIRIENEALGVVKSRFTYALGKLVLWSRDVNLIDDAGTILHTNAFNKLAIADPKLAPYGVAAMEVINAMALGNTLREQLVTASNISQTYQFVSTGNAELGFIALSQVFADGVIKDGSGWVVPKKLYSPIRQDAILLQAGKDNPAALALMAYLQDDAAKTVILNFGYVVE